MIASLPLASLPLWSRERRSRVKALLSKLAWLALSRTPETTKRLVDIAGSGLALLLASPVLLVIAALIKLEDGGPILYWQWRVGRHGRVFRFPKFRSMVVNAEEKLAAIRARNQHGGDGITFKMKNDPRITRIGRILRRFSLDESPQLWCVLVGDMTLVGPRPALPAEVARYSIEDRRRLDAVPGLTCIWQVSGRSNLPFPIQCRMDVEYIERRNLLLDLRLLTATVPAVVTGRGAY